MMDAPKRIWRDDLALAMLAGWVNAPVDKMPPEMRAHTCEATATAWGRVADAARAHLAIEALTARAEAAEARVRELEARLAAENHVFFENVRLPPDALKSDPERG